VSEHQNSEKTSLLTVSRKEITELAKVARREAEAAISLK
jgi:hypothetical protein